MLAARAADAINLFAIDVYQHMQQQEGNLFYSPLSIATGLAMAYAGAFGQTAAEMEETLHFGSSPGIHDSFRQLMESFAAHNEGFLDSFPAPPQVLTVANSVWPDDSLSVEQAFLDLMGDAYGAHVQTVDYANPQQAENTINNWVRSQTANKIPNLVSDLDASIRLILTNAAYFNAYWERPFDPEYTEILPFHLETGETVNVSTMYTETLQTLYSIFDGFAVLELPFDGGAKNSDYSMVLILPPADGATNLTPELFSEIDAWLDESPIGQEVLVRLPKINTAVSTDLNELLSDLGMPTAFELGAADFSGMTPEDVAIAKVFHKATLTINEQGTTAAAATEVDFYICFAAGTPVLTPAGPKLIEELKEGDLVLARDENYAEGDVLPKRVEKVHRRTAPILELRVQDQVIRTTETHPFFVKEKGWTTAGELQPRDLLCTRKGYWVEVDSLLLTAATEPVFNLRVADYHTYFVGKDEWGFALWVHNACGNEPEFFVDRPFHLMIRDNITSTIAFMGRIDDPRQSENNVAPVYAASNADFDSNSVVDGADFLAWQRGVGKSNPSLADGDANDDGNVNAIDLAAWGQAFGQSATQAESAVASLLKGPPPAHVESREAVRSSTYARLIDAAMATELFGAESNFETPLVDDPTAMLQLSAYKYVDLSIAAIILTADADAIELIGFDGGDSASAVEAFLDDDPLAIQVE